jgi:hypothetical protein
MDVNILILLGALLGAVPLCFLLLIRNKDLPKPAPVSPFKHLDERKASIYENLRDLQFEYRVGKLSDADYLAVKLDLQKELAGVLAAIDEVKAQIEKTGSAPAVPVPAPAPLKKNVCPSCGATFEKALKFCGECGKPMAVAK